MNWDWETESPLTAHIPTKIVTWLRFTTAGTCDWVKCGRSTDLVIDKSIDRFSYWQILCIPKNYGSNGPHDTYCLQLLQILQLAAGCICEESCGTFSCNRAVSLQVCPCRLMYVCGEILLGHSMTSIVTRTIFLQRARDLKCVQCALHWLTVHRTLDFIKALSHIGQTKPNLKVQLC